MNNALNEQMKKSLVIALFLFATAIVAGFLLFSGGHKGTISIGKNDWTGYDPLVLAESKNLFQKHNVDVTVKRYKSAEDELAAFRRGEVQGAGLTLDEAVSLHESGFRIKAVLVVDFSFGGDMIIGQNEIKHINQIVGKRVGYEGTLVGEFLLHRALVTNNIKESDIELIQVKGEDWVSSFKEKKIDALVCYNPDATTLIEHDKANLLFSSNDIPNEIIDVLVFEKEFYDKNKSSISKIALAWFDAVSLNKTNVNEAAKIIAAEKNIPPKEYIKGLTQLVSPDLNENMNIFRETSKNNIYKYSQVIIDFMLEKGLISKRVNTDEFFTNEILESLRQ